METFDLSELRIAQDGWSAALAFASAKLTVVSDSGVRLWYIDAEGIAQTDVLERFLESENIRVELAAVTAGGRRFEGVGYFHPTPAHRAAAIRGDDVLRGY